MLIGIGSFCSYMQVHDIRTDTKAIINPVHTVAITVTLEGFRTTGGVIILRVHITTTTDTLSLSNGQVMFQPSSLSSLNLLKPNIFKLEQTEHLPRRTYPSISICNVCNSPLMPCALRICKKRYSSLLLYTRQT